MLHVEHVSKTFFPGTINEKKALQDLSLHLEPGDFATVIGGNGAGKSTTLNAIAGVFPIDKGKIIIDGEDITKKPEHKRAKYIGRVFQDPMTGTTATMQIDENLALAARRGQKRGLRWGITKAEKEQFHELLKELDLGLEDRMTSKVGLLSGGQRQAVTLLMASLQKPKVLLLDEPTRGIDVGAKYEIYQLIIDLANRGKVVIVVSSEMPELLGICDRIMVMSGGRLAGEIDAEEATQELIMTYAAKYV